MFNEEEIIEELKDGKQESFGLLYEKYSKSVYAVILKIVHNRDVTDDLVQITFMKVLKNIKLYEKYKGTFYNFVCAIGKNTALDYLKKVKVKVIENEGEKVVDRETTLDDGLINLLKVKENVVSTIETDELMRDLKEAVSELAENQQIAIRLYCERQFSYRAAAKVMGISESSFKSILYRARQTLKDKIREKYPDLFEEINTRKYVARMIVMAIIGITAITGLVYATYMICNDIWSKKTFTLNELNTEISHDSSIISPDEALERINFYLDVLGEEKADAEELKLIKDYRLYKVCWTVDRGSVLLRIDSTNGELVSYTDMNDNGILKEISLDELYEKLGLPADYEMFEESNVNNSKIVLYAKKYGDIYNQYESISISIYGENIGTIRVLRYPYEDKEILISREKAIEIAEENNIEVDTIELSIEKIYDLSVDEEGYNSVEIISQENWEDVKLFKNSIEIKEVWKIIANNESILIDANTGEIISEK